MPETIAPILIAGPTAAGKSALALSLAKKTGGCVINADALQVYRCWRVLSARPDSREAAQAPHYLYGHVACDTVYSTGLWLRDVARVLAQARARGERPIIIGGTGLYFTALTQGLAEIPDIDAEIRNEGNRLREKSQTATMLEYLQKNDPETFDKIDRLNPVRVQRAWEIHRSSGTGMANWHRHTPPPLIAEETATCLVLEADRDWLAERIDKRFAQMLEQGAIDEVREVLRNEHDATLPAMQAIGAAEIAQYLRGELTFEQLHEQGSAQSRQYAKRQRTWFRNRLKAWQRIPAHAPQKHLTPDIL